MKKLTPREKKVLEAIVLLGRAQGYPPTLEEIGDAVGIGTRAGVSRHVQSLVHKRYLEQGKGRRSLRVVRNPGGFAVPSPGTMVTIPVYQRVRGGPLDLASTDVEDFVSVPREWLRGAGGFAVHIVGDSMAPTLEDGDLVVVKSRAVAQTGDVVVVLVGDEATVKRFRRVRDRVFLVPDNPKHKTLEFPRGEGVRILGKVVRSVRPFS